MGGLFDGGAAGQHDQVGERDFLAAALGVVEGFLDALQYRQHLGELIRLVGCPFLLRGEPDAGAVGAAALVGAAESGGRCPGGEHEFANGEAGPEDGALERGDVGGVDQGMVDGGNRVLPDEDFRRHVRAEVARARPHVAVGELEPGAGKGVGESLRVLVEAAGNRFVDRVVAQREIGRGHHRAMFLAGVVGVGNHVFLGNVLSQPLLGAGGALDEFPFVSEKHVEIAVVPLRRIRFPRTFDAAGGGVHALAAAEGVLPAETHFFKRRAFGRGADQCGIAGAVGLAEGVAASDERDGFLVVHGHAGEGLAHVTA